MCPNFSPLGVHRARSPLQVFPMRPPRWVVGAHPALIVTIEDAIDSLLALTREINEFFIDQKYSFDSKLFSSPFGFTESLESEVESDLETLNEIQERAEIPLCRIRTNFKLHVLLSLIFQYLIGGVISAISKTYSSGSLEFRDTFVSIVLFQGSYVWIKFRQVACPGTCRKRKSSQTPDHASPFNDACDVLEGVQEGVYRRAMKDRLGTITHYKYEPRFKPPRERLDSGATLKFNCLSLGQYNTRHEAQIVRQIAAFFYGKEECRTVQLENGLCFSVPSMSEEEKSFSGMEKAKCVARKTKAVYAEFLEEKKARELQLRNTAIETDSHFSHVNGSRTGCSQAAEIQVCERPGTSNSEFTLFPDVEPSLAPLEFDELGSFWANAPAPQPSALDNGGVTEIVAHPCSLQADEAAAQGLEHIERQSMSLQMVSLLGKVNHLEQLVTHQKKRLEDSAMWNVELQHQLMVSDIRNSELQRENERLRTMFQQVPKSHVADIDVPIGRIAG